MSIQKYADISIKRAAKSPFDGLAPVDTAHFAAQAVLADLSDRRGIKQELVGLDDDVKIELTETLAEIIRRSVPPQSK